MIDLTREELEALRFWLSVVGHRGTREQLREALAVYDAVLGKIDSALGSITNPSLPAPTAEAKQNAASAASENGGQAQPEHTRAAARG